MIGMRQTIDIYTYLYELYLLSQHPHLYHIVYVMICKVWLGLEQKLMLIG
jgi:hypothetical protein